MRHQHDGSVGLTQGIDALGHDLQSVNIEAGISLVQDGQPRLQHRHLQDLVALFLAARETLIQRAIHLLLIHLQQLQFFAEQGDEIHGIHFVQPAILANRVERRAQKVRIADAGNFHRILEG